MMDGIPTFMQRVDDAWKNPPQKWVEKIIRYSISHGKCSHITPSGKKVHLIKEFPFVVGIVDTVKCYTVKTILRTENGKVRIHTAYPV